MKFRLLICSILSTIITGSLLNLKVNAIPFTYRFNVNLADCDVYYSDTYASSYGERTMRGCTSWYSSSLAFSLRFYRVSSSANREISCRLYNDPSSLVLAKTTFYYSGNMIDPDQSNWNSCTVAVNNTYDVSYSTLTHEFGHVLGLGHNSTDPNSIMCQTGAGRIATAPANIDRSMLNYMYHSRN